MDWTHVISQAKAQGSLTQAQLASLVGCTQSCISSLEQGKTLDPHWSVGSKLLELASRKPTRRKARAPELAGEA